MRGYLQTRYSHCQRSAPPGSALQTHCVPQRTPELQPRFSVLQLPLSSEQSLTPRCGGMHTALSIECVPGGQGRNWLLPSQPVGVTAPVGSLQQCFRSREQGAQPVSGVSPAGQFQKPSRHTRYSLGVVRSQQLGTQRSCGLAALHGTLPEPPLDAGDPPAGALCPPAPDSDAAPLPAPAPPD
jgi:hypothetical protein